MKKLIKSVFVLGSSQVATTIVAMARTKLLALVLGPVGVGLFVQLQQLQTFLAGAIPMGMQTGALRYLAKYRESDRSLTASYLACASRAFAAIALVTVALCLVFVKPLAGWAVKDQHLFLFLIPPIVGVPFLVQTTLWLTFLQAGLEFKAYSKALVTTSVFGLLVVVPIVLIWKQMGAAVHLLIVAVIGYAVVVVYARRSMDDQMRAKMRAAPFDWTVIKDLARFAGANLLPFVLITGTPFLVRTQIISDLGLAANGIYQAVMVFYIQFLGVLLNALAVYSCAKVSQLSKSSAICKEINSTVKVAIFLNVPAILFLLLFRDYAVRLFFNHRFDEAIYLFPGQMIAAYFRMLAFIVGVSMLPQERFRARNIMVVLQSGVFLSVFYAAPPHMRLQAAVWADAASWTFSFVATYIYQRWHNGYGFDRDNWRLSATGLVAVVIVALLPFPSLVFRLSGIGVAVLWLATMFTRSERAKLVGIVRTRLSRSPDVVSP